MTNEYKKCPFCGEDILVTAKKCKHCGEWLISKDEAQEIHDEQTGENEFTRHPIKSILGTVFILGIFLFLFGNPFSDEDRIVNEQDDLYCVKTHIGDNPVKRYCSELKENLITFNKCIKSPEARQLTYKLNSTGMSGFMSPESLILSKCKSVDIVIADDEKLESLKKEQKDKKLIKSAISTYRNDLIREKAKEYGVSEQCYKDYEQLLETEGTADLQNLPCSSEENKNIQKYMENLSNQNASIQDDIEPIYTNAGMPKSLVLQDVSINCFEKANIGDDSKCNKKEIEKIKNFFKDENKIDWNNEYFEY